MKTAYLCLLVAGLMPIFCAAIAKWGFKDFDNHNPRNWLSHQTGFRARANAAQANCFESFPFFATSVISALLVQTDAITLNYVCMFYLGLRALYIFFYISDKATLRTLMWAGAYACIVFNFVQTISATS
jgi:uncharacterized MAPEG superfamily protein